MKFADIQRLRDAGLISEEQRQSIVAHFGLKEEGGKLLAILSMFGAVLIAAGLTLLIAAHWNEISRGVKITCGLMLMLGAHGLGWWLREVHGKYRKSGEALQLLGSCLFLANIALLGQIYNIVSRPPNALLAWWLGIAALPWLLRSKAQHVLLLVAFGIWVGFEANASDSWLYVASERQLFIYAALGLVYLGFGWVLRGGSYAEFAAPAEALGLMAFLLFNFPLTWKHFFAGSPPQNGEMALPAGLGLGLILAAAGARNLTTLNHQWRWTWFGALAGMSVLMMSVWFGAWTMVPSGARYWQESWSYAPAVLGYAVFCLLQIQVGIHERSSFLVNAGIIFIALDIVAAYFDLFGSMTRTGLMFIIGGAFMIGFGIYLEKQRRALMRRIRVAQ